MSLPTTGQLNWGTPLNQYIQNVVLAQANAAAAGLSSHQAASDPHGDRAYALSLVAPLTSGVNGPNGFLQLNSAGKIPTNVLPPGGGRTAAFDVVKDYNAPTNGTTDASTAIQNALNDCGALGGGEVWVGDGNFAIGSTLYVQNNTWLHLSQGATMTRIVGGGGTAPAYMAANFNGSTSGSGSNNLLITGGKWVSDGPAAACTPFAFVDGDSITVQNTSIRVLAQSPAILFAGCTNSGADEVEFSSATPGGARSAYASSPPAVRIEVAASTVISGLNAAIYTNLGCQNVGVRNCSITGATASDGTGPYTVFGGMAGTTGAVASVWNYNIMVTGCMAVALPGNGTYPANWLSCTITNNQFSLNNGTDATPTWNPSAPGSTNQVIINNLATNTSSTPKAYLTANSAGRTGTTLTNDPTLQVTVVANAVYEVRMSVPYSGTAGRANLEYDFALPSGAFNYTSTRPSAYDLYQNTFGFAWQPVGETYANTAGSSDSASTYGTGMQILGLLQVGATGGTFAFKWAQDANAPSYPIVLLQGAYIYLTRLA